MTRAIVVTGTDTDVGKTVFAAALADSIGAVYWKPIQAGLSGETDDAIVQRLGGLDAARIVPSAYRLTTPCSPHRAAELDGIEIDTRRLSQLPDPGSGLPLVIEGAGGVLVPITRTLLQADLFAKWAAPVVLCARTALGTINHTLLSLEALRSRRVAVLGIAFIGAANEDSERTVAEIGAVKRLGRLETVDPLDRASLQLAFRRGFGVEDFGA